MWFEIFSLVWLIAGVALVIGFGFRLTWLDERKERRKAADAAHPQGAATS
jgi:hypothetical protein